MARTAQDYIDRATAIIAAGNGTFDAKAREKEVLDFLTRAYDCVRRDQRDEFLAGLRAKYENDEDGYFAALREEVEFPYSLAHYRPAKHAAGLTDERRAVVDQLVELRQTAKNTPVVKPKSKTEVRQERLEQSASIIDNIKGAFDEMAPAIEADFINHFAGIFNRLMEQYGDWPTAYSASKHPSAVWASHAVSQVFRFTKPVKGEVNSMQSQRELNTEYLNKSAKEYAADQIASFTAKLALKLEDLKEAEVTFLRGLEFTLKGKTKGNDDVTVNQTCVLAISKLGNPFCRWPALIYVNGQRMTEAAFKKFMKGE